eukprot:4367236-Alexandrium_andersonii.AAC.1
MLQRSQSECVVAGTVWPKFKLTSATLRTEVAAPGHFDRLNIYSHAQHARKSETPRPQCLDRCPTSAEAQAMGRLVQP